MPESKFTQLKEIFLEKYPVLRNHASMQTYHAFIKATRGFFNAFVKALCKPNTPLDQYPMNDAVQDQIKGLLLYAKKSKEILFIRSLILAANTQDYLRCIYSKDATSSGLQIISMLLGNFELATKTNVIGSTSHDLYMDCVNIFKDRVAFQNRTLEHFYELIFKQKTIPEHNTKNSLADYFAQLLRAPSYKEFLKIYHHVALAIPLDIKETLIIFYFPVTDLDQVITDLKAMEVLTIDVIEKQILKTPLFRALYHAWRFQKTKALLQKIP